MKNGIVLDTESFAEEMAKVALQIPSIKNFLMDEIAPIAIRKVKKYTPVGRYPKGSGKVGGTLRRSWKIERSAKRGSIILKNNVKYAMPVENGHRTRNGGFVAGRFMLKKTMSELEKELPPIMSKFVKDIFNSLYG